MLNIEEALKETREMKDKVSENWKALKIDDCEEKIKELEARMNEPGFWDTPEEANQVSKELSDCKKMFSEWSSLKGRIVNLLELIDMVKKEDDHSLYSDIEIEFNAIKEEFKKKEIYVYFRNKFDNSNAYLSINAGAGGTESNDWVSMLYRMYMRWAELNSFEVEVVDELPGEEAGTKNVTLLIKGPYVYGNLRGEGGVHRLVRISPFDSNARRHTSFASVSIFPEINDEIEIEINPEDLKTDTYRSGGAGGQHVNKTESAVRITHIPTGIIVACQQDRSQHKNREIAMNMLKSKLYQHYEKLQADEHKKISGEKKDIAWGSQIRSYVFQPYRLVKDHRTGCETGNVDKVMDGYLEEFIFEFLKWDLKSSLS